MSLLSAASRSDQCAECLLAMRGANHADL
jgi:hypothetical protein